MQTRFQRWLYAAWLLLICVFAVLHAVHLGADFPNHSPWAGDWAKYTDEGWYGNAAVRARLFGNWYLPGDFNPAVALPVWPFLEWIVFGFSGVSLEAARALAVSLFFINLGLTYLLLRSSGPLWRALIALTLIATSPFLYAFSRLAILEPLLITLTLAALNLAVHLPGMRRPIRGSAFIGIVFAAMMLTKTTAVFLFPALVWAMALPLRREWKRALSCVAVAATTAAAAYGGWLLLVIQRGLLPDYRYLFFINTYDKPSGIWWPLESLWWSFHGGLWVDRILIPLAGIVVLLAVVAWRAAWARSLRIDPVFGASILAVAGYILFMTMQDHPQPRYFAVVAVFCFILVAQGAAALLPQTNLARTMGWGIAAAAAIAAVTNAAWTLSYVAFPEYTFLDAAQRLTRYIDTHPNGKRLLVSISGDQITMATHLPSLCDDFGTMDLPQELAAYNPGWYAAWNDLDPGTLADLHTRYSLEQVASFHAFDHPERNVLVLFKLHPLPQGTVRDEGDENLQQPLPDDKIDTPTE
ncbi:MAG TPA: glycosyltransferase family 39 protein [Terracidiphilus sp.]|nr:glycosyltransferase family 39 protein [Terracidiphilus sp.]